MKAAIILTGEKAMDLKPRLAHALNMSERTADRVISGERPLEDEEIEKAAVVLAVPEWFLREGFEGANGQPAEGQLAATLVEFREEMTALADEFREAREVLLRQARGETPGSP